MPGDRTSVLENHWGGYCDREFQTRLGELVLLIPKLRTGSYFPVFLEPRRQREQAFVNVPAEAYVVGASTRKVEALMEALGCQGLPKSEVSRLAQELDVEVEVFRNRTMEGPFRFLWLECSIRRSARATSVTGTMSGTMGHPTK